MNMKRKDTQKNEWIDDAFPCKERICSILGLSYQSTHEEILHLYQVQMQTLDSLCPSNLAEHNLIIEKKNTLQKAIFEYTNEYNQSGEPRIATAINKPKKRNEYRMYSFHIPCIFWCISKVGDAFWNCCCAWCTTGCGEDPKENCFSECYSEGGPCECLRPIDTVIAIGAIIAGVIWLLGKIGPGISEAAGNASAERTRNRNEKDRQNLIRQYNKNYIPELEKAYEEWSDLRRYSEDIRGFLNRITIISVSREIDADYRDMKTKVDKEYIEVEVRWKKLQQYLDELSNTKNEKYYSYLRSEAPGRDKYLEMFNNRKLPWQI